MAATSTGRIILCPLEIEAKSLRKAGLSDSIMVCGPGQDAVEEQLRQLATEKSPSGVILAGLAGGLNPTILAGEAHWIDEILDEEGRQIAQKPSNGHGTGRSICTVPNAIETVSAKTSLYRATEADLVDMESRRFVEVCQELGLDWGILRGISDEAIHELPAGSLNLVDANGRAKPMSVLSYLARNPLRIAGLIRLARRSSRAMKQVANELNRVSR